MRRFAVLALALTSIALAGQTDVLFQDAARSLVLRGFVSHKLSRTADEVRFSGTGTPAVVDAKSAGTLLQGQEVSGVAKTIGRLFVLQEMRLAGGGVVVVDTRERETFQLAQNPATPKAVEHSRTRIDSNTLTYAGGQDAGTVSSTSKLHVVSNGEGTRQIKKSDKDVAQTFTQALDLTGSSGSIDLDPAAKTSISTLLKGAIQGPVDFVFKRKEQDADSKEPVLTDLVGRGDLLTFDFTGPQRTITLSGNVRMVGTGSFEGETNVDKLIITVDEKLQPIRYETEGKPTTTKIKTDGGGRS